MVINQKVSKIKKFAEVYFVRTNLVRTFFISSIILSQMVTDSSLILPTYLPVLKLHFATLKI